MTKSKAGFSRSRIAASLSAGNLICVCAIHQAGAEDSLELAHRQNAMCDVRRYVKCFERADVLLEN